MFAPLVIAVGCGVHVTETHVGPKALQAVDCVAVLPFDNSSGVAEAGWTVAETVADRLLTSGRFAVLEPAEAVRIVDALALPQAPVDAARARALGERLGVGGVLIGAVRDYPGPDDEGEKPPVFGFSMRLVDVQSGEVVWQADTSAKNSIVPLALPRSRLRVLRRAVASSLASLGETPASTPAPRAACWHALPPMPTKGELEEPSRVATARVGESLEQLVTRVLTRPEELRRVLQLNPGLDAQRPFAAPTAVELPRSFPYTVASGDTLARVAENLLGHAGYWPLLVDLNREVLAPQPPRAQAAPGELVLEVTQRRAGADIFGSVVQPFVVVNGVPVTFPRVRLLARYLAAGGILAVRDGRPTGALFFDTEVEGAEHATRWRLVVRRGHDAAQVVAAGDGAPPSRVPWPAGADAGVTLEAGETYAYQLHVEYADGTSVWSPAGFFGAGVPATATKASPFVLANNEPLPLAAGRFAKHIDADRLGGGLRLTAQRADHAMGSAVVAIPPLALLRPQGRQTLPMPPQQEKNERAMRPPNEIEVEVPLAGMTTAGADLTLDGEPVAVAPNGQFETLLHLGLGKSVHRLRLRTPSGEVTSLDVEASLALAESSPLGSAPVARSPLPAGVVLRVPVLPSMEVRAAAAATDEAAAEH